MYVIILHIENNISKEWDYVRDKLTDTPMMFDSMKEGKIYILKNRLEGTEIHKL